MVDELNDETERRMDEMENRTRALAARVEALTAERDAVITMLGKREFEIASLRAQVEQMRGAAGALNEAINVILGKQWVLKARVAHVRRWVDDPNVRPEESCQRIEGGIAEWHQSLVSARHAFDAALSPSPASGSALFPGVPLVPHEGPVTYEPKTTLPGVIEAELTPKARLTIERMDGSAETLEWRAPEPGKDGGR